MHYELHDSSGTPLLLLHGGLFDIHQQFGELLPGKFAERPINANHRGGRLKLAQPQVLTISRALHRFGSQTGQAWMRFCVWWLTGGAVRGSSGPCQSGPFPVRRQRTAASTRE